MAIAFAYCSRTINNMFLSYEYKEFPTQGLHIKWTTKYDKLHFFLKSRFIKTLSIVLYLYITHALVQMYQQQRCKKKPIHSINHKIMHDILKKKKEWNSFIASWKMYFESTIFYYYSTNFMNDIPLPYHSCTVNIIHTQYTIYIQHVM